MRFTTNPLKHSLRCLFLLLLVSNTPAAATTFTVDTNGGADYLAIAPAIAAAASGDTILVAAGQYSGPDNRDLNFSNLNIVLMSIEGPLETTINGNDLGRAFHVAGGQTPATVIDGFTIINASVGSPVFVGNFSAPTIRNCRILGNNVSGFPGGAVRVVNASPRFVHCLFAENSTDQHGGAVAVSGGSPIFDGCSVIGNISEGRGGGFWLDASATVEITSGTITGNTADNSNTGFDGGGLAVTGGADVSITRTILWGNRGTSGDELFAAGGTGADLACCIVDFAGLGGGGSIVVGPSCIDKDPHFCLPAFCRDLPWTYGKYTLAANSPGLPANNPCGLLIGASVAGCDSVAVWTHAGGTGDWHDSTNWSTGSVPGPGILIQINRGEVNIFGFAEVGGLIQCPESVPSDTLWVRPGGRIIYGVSDSLLFKATPAKASQSGTMVVEEESECKADTDPFPLLITRRGKVVFTPGAMAFGPGGITNDGTMTFMGDEGSEVDCDINNSGSGGDGQVNKDATLGFGRGLLVTGGRSDFLAQVINTGHLVVADDASMGIAGTLTNMATGLLEVDGSLVGAGALDNIGTVVFAGGGLDSLDVAITNQRNQGLGLVGEVSVAAGTRQMTSPFFNNGILTVDSGAVLELSADFHNLTPGDFALAGSLSGGGTLFNLGRFTQSGPGSATVTSGLTNVFDPTTGRQGFIRIFGGVLTTGALTNNGTLRIDGPGTLAVTETLDNGFQGLINSSGWLNLPGGELQNAGTLSPGFPFGDLSIAGSADVAGSGIFRVNIGGPGPGIGHDRILLTGTANLSGTLHMTLQNDFLPAAGDSFLIVSAAGGLLGDFDRLAGTQLSSNFALQPTTTPNGLYLVATLGPVGNGFPVAVPDSFLADISQITVLSPLDNDSDPDFDLLSIIALAGAPAFGTAYINEGSNTLSYLPPLAFVPWDSLAYVITDGQGAVDTTRIFIELTDLSSVHPGQDVPAVFGLRGNFPNPFNPVTRISFEIPKSGQVLLEVVDLRGRQVAKLVAGHRDSGRHYAHWWGLDSRGTRVSSGVYFSRLSFDGRHDTGKMLLVK